MATKKRELIAPNGDKRLIRRDDKGRIKESDDLGKSGIDLETRHIRMPSSDG